jgi:hypothetical protein
MLLRILLVSFISGAFALPTLASAQGFFGPIVHCGNDVEIVLKSSGDPRTAHCERPGDYIIVGDCEFCDIVQIANRIIRFLVAATVLVATIMFVYAGILFLTAGANEGNVSKAKGIFWSVLLGLVFVLASWLIIDIIMRTLYDDSAWGPWNEILCKRSDPNETCHSLNTEREGGIGPTGTVPPPSFCFSTNIPNPSGGGWTKQCCYADTAQCDTNRATAAGKIAGVYPAATNVTPCAELAAPAGCTGNLGPFEDGVITLPPPPGGFSRENCSEYTDSAVLAKCEQESLKANQLTSAGFVINKGFCAPNTTYQSNPGGCTDVGGISGAVINTLITMLENCGRDISRSCSGIVVTGGSEFGHAGGMSPPACTEALSHCAGNKVDFGFSDVTNAFYNNDETFVDGTCSDGRRGRINADTNTCWVRESDHYDILFN